MMTASLAQFGPRAIGEIAVHCADPARMAAFDAGVIGLTRLGAGMLTRSSF